MAGRAWPSGDIVLLLRQLQAVVVRSHVHFMYWRRKKNSWGRAQRLTKSCAPIGGSEEVVKFLLTRSCSGLAAAGSQAPTQPLTYCWPPNRMGEGIGRMRMRKLMGQDKRQGNHLPTTILSWENQTWLREFNLIHCHLAQIFNFWFGCWETNKLTKKKNIKNIVVV